MKQKQRREEREEEKMKVKIIGVMKGKNKAGKSFSQYYYQKEFTDYEAGNNDCAGMATGNEFSYTDYNLKPGDECDFQYEPGFQGRATLSEVVVLKEAVTESVKASTGGK